MSDITQILQQLEAGDRSSSEELLPLVYEELRRLAAARLSSEKPGQTLQATALVHDAYLRLVDVKRAQRWNSRGHFFSAAAEAMRRILVERARRKAGPKAGGHLKRRDITCVDPEEPSKVPDLLALDEALTKLSATDERKAELVKLRFFAGLSNDQAAEALGISARTAYSDWGYAKAWLRVEMGDVT